MKFVPKELRETADTSRGQSDWRSFLKNSLAVAAFFVCLYILLGLAADLIASHISEQLEARLFSIKAGIEESESPEFKRTQRLFGRLLQQPDLRPLPYRLFLFPADHPNAVAVVGGSVGVSPALLQSVSGDMGLAMVLGHELGHHQLRHCVKRLGRALLYRGAMALLFGAQRLSVIDAALYASETRYSRRQEREADEFGLKLVHQTYGHTREALEFFEMILREHESGNTRWSTFLASHPHTLSRLNYLRKLQRSLDRSETG